MHKILDTNDFEFNINGVLIKPSAPGSSIYKIVQYNIPVLPGEKIMPRRCNSEREELGGLDAPPEPKYGNWEYRKL